MANGTDGEKEYPVLYQAQLRRLLVQRFSYEELKILAFDLGSDLDDLSGQGKSAKSRELVAAMKHASRLGELAAEAERQRPNVAWPQPMPPGKENPYKSLSAFREEDAHLFFGREADVIRLATAARKQSLTALVGPSGSGKSSLVFAGLVPRLRQGRDWLIADFRPGSGTRPLHALASSLLPLLDSDLITVDKLTETKKLVASLEVGELTLADLTGEILKERPKSRHLILIVDQFEELYTQIKDEEERNHFLDVLVGSQGSGNDDSQSSVVLTLRADFLGQALEYRPFADALQNGIQTLGPMSREELEKAVIRPAEGQGVFFEDGLMERILDEVGSGAGSLPLLEFCLSELWGWGGDGKLSHVAYEAIGRVDGSLANHAETVYEELDPAAQEEVRRMMLNLVQPGQSTEDTRRLATQDELGARLWPYAQALAGQEARLVVVSRDETGRQTAEIVHEAVIQSWPRLRDWIDEDRAFLIWQERLRFSLQQYQDAKPDESTLLRGASLEQAEIWQAEREDDLSQLEREFIQASVTQQKQEQRQKKATRLITRGALTLLLLLILLWVRSFWSSNCLAFGQAVGIGVHCQKIGLLGIDLFRADLSEKDFLSGEKNLVGANLTGANLTRAELSEADLSGARLTGADLSQTILFRANLTGADLSQAFLGAVLMSQANLSRANLSEARMSGASLVKSELLEADLTGAVLNNADLFGVDLSGADLSGADLIGAELTSADLTGAVLNNADLFEVDLSGTNLTDADLTMVNLADADLSDADLTMVNLTGANLTYADLFESLLAGADLAGADLTGADLTGADLSGANLTKADLNGAFLNGADMTGANLTRADLSGADLSRASLFRADLSNAILFEALYNEETIWTEGFDPEEAGADFISSD